MEEKDGKEETFLTMEKEFHVVLDELAGDKSMDRWRQEYEKVFNALKKSNESEKSLKSKCHDLNTEIASNSTKVATALKQSQDDRTTIHYLKNELEIAWKNIDKGHEENKSTNGIITTLKEEIENLNELIERGVSLSTSEENDLKEKEQLTTERDQLLTTMQTLREDIAMAAVTQQKLDESQRETISQLQQELQVNEYKISREKRRSERLEKDMEKLQANTEAKMADIKALTLQSQQAEDEHHRLQHQLRELKILNDRTTKELENMHVSGTKLQNDHKQLSVAMEHISVEYHKQAKELKMKEEVVVQKNQEIVKLTKMREALQKRYQQVEDQKKEVEVQQEILKNKICGLEKALEASNKQAEISKKNIDELVREREILKKNVIKATSATKKQQNMVRLQEQDKKTLNQEIHNYHEETQKQRKIICQLEKDRERYINETSNLRHTVQQHTDNITVKETELFGYKKQVGELENKRKQLQNLYESVVSERNLYSKELIVAQDEITEMKRKLKIINHQIDQLKEEISGKDADMAREHQEFQHVEKENEGLKEKMQLMKQQAEETKHYIDSQITEEQTLRKVIADADTENFRQKQELDQVIRERGIMGSQLLRRNDELKLLYEMNKTQKSILNKGDIQYQQRMEDIRLLKLEIKKCRHEKIILGKTASDAEDLRWELVDLQKELLKERTRNSKLQEMLENPTNLHRWRKLEGSDPDQFRLIQKIQSLLKRLITKTQEVVDKEILLQEKEREYVELKQTLSRQQGPETAEQLQQSHWTIKQKTKKIKALTVELNMYESKVKEYKSENEKLAEELQSVKQKNVVQKRQRGEEKTKAKTEQQVILPQINKERRLMGGGFNFSNPPTKKINAVLFRETEVFH